jgi:hypothetical protein
VAQLDPFAHVVDNGTDVSIYFDWDHDGSWTGDGEDAIVLKGLGIAAGVNGINSLAELQSSMNVLVE